MLNKDRQPTCASLQAVPATAPGPVRICHVLQVADRETFARLAPMWRQLNAVLQRENVRSSWLTDEPAVAAEHGDLAADAMVVPNLQGWRSWLERRSALARLARRPDLVHAWGTQGLEFVARWAARQGVPLVVSLLAGADVARTARLEQAVRLTPVAACPALARRLEALRPERVHPVACVVPGVQPGGEAAVGGHGSVLGLIWSGRFDEHSGLDVLVDALVQLRARGYEFQAGLIGAGPAASHYWRQLRQKRLEGWVSLIDEPRLWEQTIRGAHACIVPARERAVALAPLQAMASGTIVIASRGQTPEWFIEGRTCWQFTPGSAVELAYHLTRLGDRYHGAAELARTAQHYVAERHRVDAMGAQICALYRRITAAAAGVPAGREPPAVGGTAK